MHTLENIASLTRDHQPSGWKLQMVTRKRYTLPSPVLTGLEFKFLSCMGCSNGSNTCMYFAQVYEDIKHTFTHGKQGMFCIFSIITACKSWLLEERKHWHFCKQYSCVPKSTALAVWSFKGESGANTAFSGVYSWSGSRRVRWHKGDFDGVSLEPSRFKICGSEWRNGLGMNIKEKAEDLRKVFNIYIFF